MTEQELRKLKSHYQTLKSERDLFESFASSKTLVVDTATFRVLADEINRIKAGFPHLLPPFTEADFESGRFEGENEFYYKLAPVRAYLASALPKIAAEIEALPAVDVPSMKVTREGVFFAGQYFDALQRVTDILAQADEVIWIVDNYVDAPILSAFTSKKPHVQVNILTKNVPETVKIAALAFNKQYGKLSMRTSSAFHDRFVVIDDKEFYHFGASLKDVGHRGFMFSRIEEPAVLDAFKNALQREWSTASVVI